MTAQDSQIAAFLERLPAESFVGAEDANEPMVIFRGALELTREQEDFVVSEAFKRIDDLDSSMGRAEILDASETPPVDVDMDTDALKHLPRRMFWEMVFNQKFGWRKQLEGLFKDGSNVHFPMTRRIVNQMVSRAQNYFFQTEPWFSANALGVDMDTGKAANDWAQYRFSAAGVKGELEQAIKLAFVRGECVVKTQSKTRYDYYEAFESVMVDGESNPILDANGGYILEDDEFVLIEGGDFPVLKRDGVTTASGVFELMKIPRRSILFKGPEAAVVPLRDFVASMDRPTLQEEDTVCHYYDMDAIAIVEEYIERLKERGAWDEKEWPRVVELLSMAAAGSRDATAGAGAYRPETGDSPDNASGHQRSEPLVKIAEVHMWIDANSDGKRENIMMLLDTETRRPILYDYTANIYEDKVRPFSVVRIDPVDGRWTGTSAVETLWRMQNLIDLNMNRWDFSNSVSGSVTFFNPELLEESQGNRTLKLNHGKTYRKRDPKTKAEDIVERVQLAEYKGVQLETIIQYWTQIATNLGGVANVNDAQMAGLDSTRLATGIRNMDASGQEQFSPFLSALTPGLTDISEKCLVLSVATSDEEELFDVMGQDGAMMVQSIRRGDLRKIKWSLELELTRYKNEQEAKQAQFARPAAVEFYNLPPVLQMRLATLYRQELKAYGVRNVDQIIVLPTAEDFANYAAAQQMQAAGPGGQKSSPGQSPSLT
jgi:hypothetical protein